MPAICIGWCRPEVASRGLGACAASPAWRPEKAGFARRCRRNGEAKVAAGLVGGTGHDRSRGSHSSPVHPISLVAAMILRGFDTARHGSSTCILTSPLFFWPGDPRRGSAVTSRKSRAPSNWQCLCVMEGNKQHATKAAPVAPEQGFRGAANADNVAESQPYRPDRGHTWVNWTA